MPYPIPGQNELDLPVDDLTQMASERAGNLLMPYEAKFGSRPIETPSSGAVLPAVPPSLGIEDKLYQSIHPDTFSRVLELIMQMVTGKTGKTEKAPITFPYPGVMPAMNQMDPRSSYNLRGLQEGGDVGAGEEVIVGEKGPERFRPAVPGQILPSSGITKMGDLTYAGPDRSRWNPLGGMSTPSEYWEKSKRSLSDPVGWLQEQGKAFALPERIPIPFGELRRRETPLDVVDLVPGAAGAYEIPTPPGGQAAPYTGPAPWRQPPQAAVSHRAGEYPIAQAGGWRDYDQGIRYKLGPEDLAGDEAARQRILAEAGRAIERYGIPEPGIGGSYIDSQGRIRIAAGPGYYDAHPEEKVMDDMAERAKPYMDALQKNIDRYSNMAQGYGLIGTSPKVAAVMRAEAAKYLPVLTAEQGKMMLGAGPETYRYAFEYGPGSARSQEQLAHAEFLRRQPELEAYKISEQGRTHLLGIANQAAAHVEAARIAAEVKDPIMKEIGAVLTQGQKMSELYGTPFDPTQTISSVLKVYRAMGQIDDKQWNALPNEYKGIRQLPDFETFKTRAKAQGSKMSDKALQDAYNKLSRGA